MIKHTLGSMPTKNDRARRVETMAMYVAGFVFIVSVLIGLVYFWGDHLPLFGRHSIGSLASLLAALVTFMTFLIAYGRPAKVGASNLLRRLRDLLTVSALAFIHAAICLLIVVITFFLAQSAFQGLTLDHWSSAILTSVTVGACAYAAYLVGSSINSLRMSTSLAVFLVAGVMASMISSEDPYWWLLHFSSLGADHSGSAAAFNLTLIVAGLVIICLSDFIYLDFRHLPTTTKPTKARTIQIILICIGLMLAGVGIFKYDQYPQLHFYSAAGMAVLFLVLMAMLPRLAPNFSKTFITFSYMTMGCILVCVWLWKGVGYLNLTAFELICSAIIFAWLIVFVRNLAVENDVKNQLPKAS